ncbi:MAG: recombinase family protein [Actinobacteria bacterium]|nr:MAG: recombinase family protein [Actinomycetota bacterium]
MNCVIYLRVSTREQAEGGYSIPAQREACLRFIKDQGWNFIEEYVDHGESARSANRPQLQAMLARVKEDGSVNAVIVHKIDRLARNTGDHATIRTILEGRKVTLVAVTEKI